MKTAHAEPLRLRAERFRQLAEATFEGIVVCRQGKVTAANRQFAEMFGYDADRLPGVAASSLVAFGSQALCVDRGGRPYELLALRRDGTAFPVECRSRTAGDDTMVAVRDITERAASQEALVLARERLRHLLSSSPAVIYSAEAGGDFRATFVSENVVAMLGFPRDELVGSDLWGRQIHPDDAARVREALSSLKDGGQVTVEYRFRHKDGSDRWLQVDARFQQDSPTSRREIVGCAIEITQRKRANHLLDAILQLQSGFIAQADLRPLFTEMLAQVVELSGSSGGFVGEVLGRPGERRLEMYAASGSRDAGTDGWDGAVEDVLATGEPVLAADRLCLPLRHGQELVGVLGVAGRPGGYEAATVRFLQPLAATCGSIIQAVANLREKRKAEEDLKESEEQLRHSQKMESFGRLAGGIAHDFNNLLTVIHGYVDLAKSELDRDGRLGKDIQTIGEAAARATSLTRQLLAFSRRQVLQPRVFALNGIVTGMEKMFRRVIGEDIQLATALEPGLRDVRADPGQIEQVLLNLVVNARDAMPQGGRISLETVNVELGERFAGSHGVAPGRYAMLAVTDTGVGMDRGTRLRIFEPFFTTKEHSKGTGLGLSTAYGIVKQSGGCIAVESQLGRGSAFRVYLPSVEAGAQGDPAAPAGAAPQCGSETLLLVEDEETVRALAHRILTRSGYTVHMARNGNEALETCARLDGKLDLVVTDVVMPGMSGGELAERIAELYPDTPVLFVSGYTGDAIVHHGASGSGIPLLEKPFTPEALARRVRDVLGSGGA